MSGTNYVNGSGFCFGDQQLKEGTPFISCTSSGFTGDVANYNIFWFINGASSALTEVQVNSMYPVDAGSPQPGEFRLNISDVTNLGVSSVACRMAAVDSGGIQVGITPISPIRESIFVVDCK